MSISDLIRIKRRQMREQGRVVRFFYPNLRFMASDLMLLGLYAFCNPYRYCRKFYQKKGESNIYSYGETPLTTMQKIAHECSIEPTDRFLELGSGRGRGCLWLTLQLGCQATGIEWIPRFVNRANLVAKLFAPRSLQFVCQDVLEADFSKFSVVYLYGTSWSDEMISQITQKMKELPTGAKIISVSFPLENFPIKKRFSVSFVWGETDCFYQERVQKSS